MPDWSPRPPEEEWIGFVRAAGASRERVARLVKPPDTRPWLEFLGGITDTKVDSYEYGPRIPTPTALGALREIAERSLDRQDICFIEGCVTSERDAHVVVEHAPTCPYARLRGEGE